MPAMPPRPSLPTHSPATQVDTTGSPQLLAAGVDQQAMALR